MKTKFKTPITYVWLIGVSVKTKFKTDYLCLADWSICENKVHDSD